MLRLTMLLAMLLGLPFVALGFIWAAIRQGWRAGGDWFDLLLEKRP